MEAAPVVLHVLPVGGGIVALSGLPGSGGDYRGDLDHLASWRPAFVICLATQAELEDVGARGLPQVVQDRGTRWLHLPVADAEGPGSAATGDWVSASGTLRRALMGGGRVVICDRDGGARAGMLALRLMIEAGEAPDEAEARLAALHPAFLPAGAARGWALDAHREPAAFVRHPDRRGRGSRPRSGSARGGPGQAGWPGKP